MENLINELKVQIKEALNLEDLSVEEFDENAPLFGDDGIGLDSIDAEVIYVKEWETSKISVSIDPDIFLNHVLINVKENINTHAFGTNTFKQKYVWEKKVCVEVEDGGSQICILVDNNGEPFKGDITKVFEYGYCHGEKKHSGIGMHSIKKNMTGLGGDVEFKKSSKPDYTTSYKLILKK
jgi:nitrogen fixation/metabolism regulation signal transduction histidine kinase